MTDGSGPPVTLGARESPHEERSEWRMNEVAQLLEAAPDAMIVVDAAGAMTIVNAQAERLFGFARGQMLGQPVEMLVPSRYRTAHTGHRRAFASRPSVRPMVAGLDLYGLRSDGTEFPVEISLRPVQLDGRPVTIAAIRDVTERRRAQEALARSEAMFRSLLESAPDAMVIADGDGTITLVNTQTERLFGYARGELLGQPVEVLVPERFRTRHVVDRTAVVAEPRVRSMSAGLELYGRRKDGSEFPVEISLSPLTTAEGTLIASAIRDITERKNVEVDRAANLLEQTARVDAEAANRAKDELLATLARELRKPIDAITSALAELDIVESQDGLAKRSRQAIRRQNEQLGRIVEELLQARGQGSEYVVRLPRIEAPVLVGAQQRKSDAPNAPSGKREVARDAVRAMTPVQESRNEMPSRLWKWIRSGRRRLNRPAFLIAIWIVLAIVLLLTLVEIARIR